MTWKCTSLGPTILDIVKAKSDMTKSELTNPTPVDPNTIENLTDAAGMVKKAIADGTHISVMGDYDADGITASAILYLTLSKLGCTPSVRLPKRMSEGYGLSASIVDELSPGLLITVDNGIAANEAIQKAKASGFTVLIMDHHLPGEEIPSADIVVDPHIHPENNGFEDYCGAGLAYKLAQLLIDDDAFVEKLRALAAVGTVADSVPLRSDNRYIVKAGLESMKAKKAPVGLNVLCETAGVYGYFEKDIGFSIGPLLNAAGRMYDDGAMRSFSALVAADSKEAEILCKELVEINQNRKISTQRGMEYVEDIIQQDCLYGDAPLVVFVEGMPEGIVGIITGRIAEKYKVPTFILTDTTEPGLLKGSGRSYGGVNLKEDVLDKVSQYLVKGGGHAAAAGISVYEKDYVDMVNAMHNALAGYEAENQELLEYDLEISVDDVPQTLNEIRKYAPYGEGNPEPVIRIDGVTLSPKYGQMQKYMGNEAQHVKLFAKNFAAICFGRADDYRKMGCPAKLDFVGTLSDNVYRFNHETQLEVTDFRAAPIKAGTSTLLNALLKNGTI